MEIVIPYDPRPWQREAFEMLERFSVLCVHRRAGKTVFCINWLIRQAIEKPGSTNCYVAPQYSQAKRVVWQYLQDYAGVIPGTIFNTSELRCDLPNGSRIYLLGAENPHPLRGLGLDAAVLDEVAQMPRTAWTSVIRPALADRQGKAIFIGTPLGRANLFAELVHPRTQKPGWVEKILTWRDTEALPESEIEALRAEMPPEEFEQEMECSFDATIKGAFWGAEMTDAENAGRITSVPHDPGLPVTTCFDLGMRDSTFIWYAQVVGSEVRLIDCDEFNNTGLPDIVKHLNNKPYNYDRHLFPHDVKVRELGTGRSRVETLKGLGLEASHVPNIALMDGINAARNLIPRCWFDREKCFTGVEALKLYRSEYNEIKQVLSNAPLHDWTSHAADSFRYLAVAWQDRPRVNAPLDYTARDLEMKLYG